MTRNGKIARLPYGIREELNRRLQDGKCGPKLLKWLNGEPECLEVLEEEFEGRPITKQNLSEWRQGGYQEWVRKEEARERVQVLMEKAGDLEKDAGGMAIADRLGTLLSAELAVAMEQLDEIKDPKERWARMKEIARELYRLRREDHHARKLRIVEEQYERRTKEAERERLLDLQDAMQNKPLTAALNGGKQDRWKWTDWGIRVKYGLPMPKWWTNPQTAEEWNELMRPYWRGEADGTSPNSEVQSPKSQAKSPGSRVEGKSGPKCKPTGAGPTEMTSSKSHPPSSDYGATRVPSSNEAPSIQAPKSGPVGAGPTGSHQKSDTVKAGPAEVRSSKFQIPSVSAKLRRDKKKFQIPSSKATEWEEWEVWEIWGRQVPRVRAGPSRPR